MIKSLISASLLTACLCNAPALEQLDSVPGTFEMDNQHLPPAEQIINRSVQDFPIYGIYTWFGEYNKLREQIKQVGWKTVRIGGPKTDDNMKQLFDDGLNFVCFPNDVGGQKVGKRDNYDSDEAYLEARRKETNMFLDRFGANGSFYKEFPQYADRHVPFVMIHNEPNFHYMWKDATEAQREALYAKLAPMIIKMVHERSPKSKMISFTAGGAGAGDMRFVDHVLKIDPTCITEADGFATHPYVHPVPPETSNVRSWGSYSIAKSLHNLRKTFAKYDRADIPVWYTEGGWMISKADGGAYDKPANTVVPPALQAAYSCRYYAIAVRLGVDCVTNMFITDTDTYNGGFFDRLNNMKWRPSAFAVQTMIKVMPHPALRGVQSEGEDGVYIWDFASHALKKNSPTVTMAFRVEGPKAVKINVSSEKTLITDMLGGEHVVDTPDKKLEHEIGPLPIYVQEAQ